jgi:hypothetical protein
MHAPLYDRRFSSIAMDECPVCWGRSVRLNCRGFSGRFGGYGYGYGYGQGGTGVIGVILIVLVVLLLMGRL